MAADGITVEIKGLDDVRQALMSIVPKLRKKAIREALTSGARLVQREARRLTPILKLTTYGGATAHRRGVRAVGTVRKAISVRLSKVAIRRGDVGVFVNVRPLKSSARGAKNPKDPYYWRWINFGWNPSAGLNRNSTAAKRERRARNRAVGSKVKEGYRFLEGGAKMLQQALSVFVREIGPRIQKLNNGKGAQP